MAERISRKDFAKKVLESELPVIVDFYSDSCVACKKLAPVLADVEERYSGKLYVYKVNTNYETELVEEYGITANPTLILFKAGAVIGRISGAIKQDELEAWLFLCKEEQI